MFINLYDPKNLGFGIALVTSYLLGIIHGITPDEHTWPITFSYAIGTRSRKKGLETGLIFSSGFTIQRAIMSELAYFALAAIFMTSFAFGLVYVIVGIAMFLAGEYLIKNKTYFHLHYIERKLERLIKLHKNKEIEEKELEHKINPIECINNNSNKAIPTKLAFVHGLIAGFGFGAFALIIYTVIAPTMPSPWFGWIPGALFGLGTMTMQIVLGFWFGGLLMKMKNIGKQGLDFIARSITKNILYYGGIVFVISGILILLFPSLLSYKIVTGLKIHNLDNLDLGFFIVIFIVIGIGLYSFLNAFKKAKTMNFSNEQ